MLRYLIALVCSVYMPCASFSAEALTKRALDKKVFEKLLFEKAQSSSVETDIAGAWENIYQHVLLSRFVSEDLYKRALLKFARDIDDCKSDQATEAVYLSCGAARAADAASSLTLYAAEGEFRRDAEKFATQIAAGQPEKLIDVLLSLARTDNLWLAEQTLGRIDGLFRDHPALLEPCPVMLG